MQTEAAPSTASAADFAAFMSAHQRNLQRTAWLLTGNWDTAEDLVQTVLAKTWRHWARVCAADEPAAYVRRTLVNAFISDWRRRWRGERPTEELPDTALSDDADDVTLRLSLQQALARLPRRQRAVLVLRYFQDLTEPQVAESLGCAVGTVKSTGAKALEHLRSDPAIADLLDRVHP
jgi:RNA polymerase sigma-70 factor (sigma-E family)